MDNVILTCYRFFGRILPAVMIGSSLSSGEHDGKATKEIGPEARKTTNQGEAQDRAQQANAKSRRCGQGSAALRCSDAGQH